MGVSEAKAVVAARMVAIQEKRDAMLTLAKEIQSLQCEADSDIGALVLAHGPGPYNFNGELVKFRKSKLAGVDGHPVWLATPQKEAQ